MLKTVSSITNAIGALNYKGTWNASTNTPTLADGTGAKGDYYVVSTAGTQTFDGILLFFGAGDWIVYNGAVWQRVEGGSDGNFSNVTLNSTDAGATAGPLLDLYRNSATPAASDTIGEIEFNGKDSAGNKQQYAVIHGSILSPTSTTEQGQIHFETATAGASTEKMIIGTTNLVINDIGAVFNVRIEGDTDANLFYTDATNSRVGVGTISPATKLDVNGTITATSIIDSALTNGRVTYAGTSGVLQDSGNLTFSGSLLAVTGTQTITNSSGSTLILDRSANPGSLQLNFNGTETGQIQAVSGGGLVFFRGSSPTEAMRIDSSGNMLVGTTSALPNVGRLQVLGAATTSAMNVQIGTDGYAGINFNNAGGGQQGYIQINTSTVLYVSVSDYRLKENVVPMTGALAKVAQLKPVTYKWKSNGSDGQGFIAHELAEVCPDAVSGEKDAIDADGKPKYQGIDTSFLVATLTAAIQEQQAMIASFEARLAALENK